MKWCFKTKNFQTEALNMLKVLDDIVTKYAAQGYDLTARQVYYHCVANKLFPDSRRWIKLPGTDKWVRNEIGTFNATPNYTWITKLLSEGRLAGYIDWDTMVDRTRNAEEVVTWKDTSSIIRACAKQFRLDLRSTQEYFIEVWVEKEALEGVVQPITKELGITSLSCKGFLSQSAMYKAYQRFLDHQHQTCLLLYLGDHDPSGIDMPRDIEERLNFTFGVNVDVERIALTMEQIETYNPPPDPAKKTDTRYRSYAKIYGDECWELDALEPDVLSTIIVNKVNELTNVRKIKQREKEQSQYREQLSAISDKLETDPNWMPEDDII